MNLPTLIRATRASALTVAGVLSFGAVVILISYFLQWVGIAALPAVLMALVAVAVGGYTAVSARYGL